MISLEFLDLDILDMTPAAASWSQDKCEANFEDEEKIDPWLLHWINW
jgi:hypothetical protein